MWFPDSTALFGLQIPDPKVHDFGWICNLAEAPKLPLDHDILEQLAFTQVVSHLWPHVVHNAADLQELQHALLISLGKLLHQGPAGYYIIK